MPWQNPLKARTVVVTEPAATEELTAVLTADGDGFFELPDWTRSVVLIPLPGGAPG